MLWKADTMWSRAAPKQQVVEFQPVAMLITIELYSFSFNVFIPKLVPRSLFFPDLFYYLCVQRF